MAWGRRYKSRVEKSIAFLRGKKTYFAVAIGVLYVAGCGLGFWPLDDTVLIAVGLGGLGGAAWLRRLLGRRDGGGGSAAVLLALCGVLAAGGCATANAPGRVLATAALAVDAGMRGWAAYVGTGRATAEAEAQVRAAYVRYQAAEAAAERAYLAASRLGEPAIWESARPALAAAQGDLLRTIDTFSR